MHAVHDADPQSHERFGEINDLLPLSCDGQGGHSQVSLLKHMQNKDVSSLVRQTQKDTVAFDTSQLKYIEITIQNTKVACAKFVKFFLN